MNKKTKIISIALLSLLVVGLVSAGIVNYLSNKITGTVTVESPLVLTGDFSVEPGEIFNLITADFTLVNKVNTEIEAIVEIEVAGDKGIVSDFNNTNIGQEFEVFLIGMEIDGDNGEAMCTSQTLGGVWDDEEGYCYWDASVDKAYSGVIDGKYYVQMGDRLNPTPIPANATLNGRIKVKFKTNVAPANYTFSTQAVTPESAKEL